MPEPVLSTMAKRPKLGTTFWWNNACTAAASLRTIGGGGGTMSFMVCMSNETGKSLAGVLRDGSRMFGPVMDGSASAAAARVSRAQSGRHPKSRTVHAGGLVVPRSEPMDRHTDVQARRSVLVNLTCFLQSPVIAAEFRVAR